MDDDREDAQNSNMQRPKYGEMLSYYVGALNAQHALLTGYLSLHSFLVLANVLVLVQVIQAERAPDIQHMLMILVLLIGSFGVFMALQMRLAWDRSRAQTGLIMKFLEQKEQDFQDGWRPFESWDRLRRNPDDSLQIGFCNERFNTQWGFNFIENWFGKRAASIPWILGGLYVVLSITAVTLRLT